MKSMPEKKRVFLAFVFGVVLLSTQVEAQVGSDSQTTVLQLNQQAMTAYSNLQIAQATQLLQQAMDICTKNNLQGEPLARTHVNMGLIEAGGNQNNAAAMEHFKKAICVDPTVRLDPLNTTPEIETLFNMANNQAQAPGGCPQGGVAAPAYPQPQPTYPQPTYPQPTYPQPTYPQPQPIQPQASLIRHQPVTQQLRLVPIPIFIEVNPSVKIGKAILYYRTLGEKIFQQVPMQPEGRGYAATIGCDVLQTFDPTGIEYYVAVLDQSNQLLGTSGTEAQPHRVAIVPTLTAPPPALPNKAPPARCTEDCPPWDPDCNKACKQLGDMCDNSAECCPGMACVEEACTPSEDEGGDDYDPTYKPFFRFAVDFGSGAGLIPGGKVEPYNQVSRTPNVVLESLSDSRYMVEGDVVLPTGFAWSKFHFRASAMFYLTSRFFMGLSFRGGLALDTSGASEVLPLAPTVLGNIAFRMVGDGTSMFELDGLIGLGGGVVQHRVPYTDCYPYELQPGDLWYDNSVDEDVVQVGCRQGYWDDEDENGNPEGSLDKYSHAWSGLTYDTERYYFRKAGYFVAEVGLDSYIWFINSFGLNIGAIADFYIPDFAMNFDFQAGVAVRF